jgi:RNA polymerase sigma-70 factor, ECF subfamily
VDRQARDVPAARFFDAFRDGDVEALREVLAADVQLVGDAGGKAPALSRAVVGADKVARLLAAVSPRFARVGAAFEKCEVNG